jgi:hypothetical protein
MVSNLNSVVIHDSWNKLYLVIIWQSENIYEEPYRWDNGGGFNVRVRFSGNDA